MSGRAIVVGGGAIGIASGYFLQEGGWDVTVVERDDVGRACSYGNACLIVPSHSDPVPGPGVIAQALRWMLRSDSPFYIRPRIDLDLWRWSWQFRRYCSAEAAEKGYRALLGLSRCSLGLYEELLASGAARFFFEKNGILEVFLTEKGHEAGQREYEALTREGFPANMLSAQQAIELEPALHPGIRGALSVGGEAHGYSYGYVRSLADTFERRGGIIRTGRGVSRILSRAGRVTGVALNETGNGHGARDAEELHADVVVLSSGSWSRQLARPLGLSIPLQPAKGYSCTIDSFEGAPRIPILIKERKVIVTPLDHRLRFGGTLELAGFDLSIHPARYGAVVRAGSEVLREAPPMHNEEPWCGLRPVTPDGLPIIDRAPGADGLIVAAGHAMLGFTQSPMTGKLVAELASGTAPSLDVSPFRLDRF